MSRSMKDIDAAHTASVQAMVDFARQQAVDKMATLVEEVAAERDEARRQRDEAIAERDEARRRLRDAQ